MAVVDDELHAPGETPGLKVVGGVEHPGEMTVEEIAEARAQAHAEEPEDDDGDGTGQFVIPGTSSGMTLNAGGKKPDVSEAKLDALRLSLKGEFKKGDQVRLVVDAVVRDVRFPDEMDKAGNVSLVRRVHLFRPIAIEPIPLPHE